MRVTQQAPLLKVKRVTIIRRNPPTTGGPAETVVFEARDGAFNNQIQLSGVGLVSTIEIEFTGGPVNQDSVRQGSSFVVRRLGAAVQLQAGQLQWMSGSVVRWNATTPLSRGSYSVALLSGLDPVTNQAASSKILAIDGRTLDGEPTRLPSGNNAADGTFFFTMQVS
ncbi:MAG: hypothetical protein ACJ754_24485 [Pyrinomonadaceae bacterium]